MSLAYPWVAHQPDDYTFKNDAWISDDHDRMVAGGLRVDDVDRVVACVNACEWLADPSVVPELLAALKECSFRLGILVAATSDFSVVNKNALDAATIVMNKAEGR